MKISREEVLRVAELAQLELSDVEVEKYQQQLDSILDYIAKLNVVDTSNIEPMTQVIMAQASGDGGDANPTLREDVVVPCDIGPKILEQAPDADGAYFRVPKVLGR